MSNWPEEALQESDLPSHLNVVLGGEEARSFLQMEGPYAASSRPHLILLSLNLPDNDGYALLAEIKADKNLRHIPVVVTTPSKPRRQYSADLRRLHHQTHGSGAVDCG